MKKFYKAICNFFSAKDKPKISYFPGKDPFERAFAESERRTAHLLRLEKEERETGRHSYIADELVGIPHHSRPPR